MPAKKGGVISTGEARLIMKDQSTMKTALICGQIEAGDRRDDPPARNPNQTDTAKGFRRLSDRERDDIQAIVRRLLVAAAARQTADPTLGTK
jgi:hypothetical protein